MARRLYLGRLPPDARADDVSKFFDGYGRIIDCRVMTGFGFVEFESSRDAEDAVHQFNGKSFMGSNIVVEFAKESRPRRETYEERPPRARRPPGFRLIVSGISRDTSWQDLKDFGREAGNVSYADIDRDRPGEGILEYQSREDADRAIKELDGKDLRGQPVRVASDGERGGPDNFRREDRRDERHGREDRHNRDDRFPREDRGYRRDRSRSPPRRAEFEDRRAPRSPPTRRDRDEGRPAGHEDRRFDERRDDDRPRRDERRREEKDDRFEERPPRHGNGEGGWAR